jgi:hypothetical protein
VKVTYRPEGATAPQVFDFDHKRLPMSRATMLEARYKYLTGDGESIELIQMAAIQGGAAAKRVVLWHCLNLVHATLRIEDVDAPVGEVDVTPSAGEIRELRDAISRQRNLPDYQREALLSSLDAMAADATEELEEGKAPSASSDATTG